MAKANAANERIKRDYFRLLKGARGYDEASIDGVAQAIARFEAYTRHRAFEKFHVEQAIGFKGWLAEQTNQRSGRPLTKSTMCSTMRMLREFFLWLSGQPGFRSRISFSDTAYFRMSEKDMRAAQASADRPVPSIEQIEMVLQAMPVESVVQRRDRAVIAFTLLTGARDNATASLRLEHVDLERRMVFQDPRVVRTKGSKAIYTWFFPVGGSAESIVSAWIAELKGTHAWADSDPLFPRTCVRQDSDRQFKAVGIGRQAWSNADPVRKAFRMGFAVCGFPYCNPHSFRKTLARLGQRLCRTPELLKVWSQNLGHEQTLTTFTSYGTVPLDRQGELMMAFGSTASPGPNEIIDLLQQAVLKLTRV